GEILDGLSPNSAAQPVVDLVERTENIEVEVAATLLYSASHHSYRQIRDLVAGLPAARVAEVIEIGVRHRGKHDELLRAFRAGAELRFDILMDIGGFRDMHRHRRCVQIIQDYTHQHGYELPPDLEEGGPEASLAARYRKAIESAQAVYAELSINHPESAQYALPLATRKRALFKMDFAEALYI